MAARVALFLIDGFEETEALVTVDILRRGDVDVTTVSLGAGKTLTGRSRIRVEADAMFEEIGAREFDMLVIPGGTIAYLDHEGVMRMVQRYAGQGRKLAAICAAPAVFGKLGLLHGKRAVCYPGMESYLAGAALADEIVVTDGTITTAKGPGTAVHFALRLLEILEGAAKAGQVAADFIAQL